MNRKGRGTFHPISWGRWLGLRCILLIGGGSLDSALHITSVVILIRRQQYATLTTMPPQLKHLLFRRVRMIMIRVEKVSKPFDAMDGMEDRNGAVYA